MWIEDRQNESGTSDQLTNKDTNPERDITRSNNPPVNTYSLKVEEVFLQSFPGLGMG